jgi:hypothetical protein
VPTAVSGSTLDPRDAIESAQRARAPGSSATIAPRASPAMRCSPPDTRIAARERRTLVRGEAFEVL